jgi:hypothetical protein
MKKLPHRRSTIMLDSDYVKKIDLVFPQGLYDSRLIDSLIIQTRGVCLSDGDTAYNLLDNWSVADLVEDFRCEDCCKGKGMYAHCIVIPGWKGELSCPEYKGVCGNCRRASRAASCTCGKHWTNDPREKNDPESPLVQNARKRKDIEGRSLRPDVKQPGKYSK